MKTKLYTLITSLLMVTCITSYGQEIVNEFTILKTNKDFWECNLFENGDGTLMFRTLMFNPNTYDDFQHLFYKLTPEGEVLDSLIIDAYADYDYMMQDPLHKNSYILTEDRWVYDSIDSLYTACLRMVFIDSHLNINNDITVPLCDVDPSVYYASWAPWFIDPQNDIIVSFWTDNVHHFRRIGLDGTVKTATDGTALFEPNYEQDPQQPGGDSLLLYSEMGFGTFSQSPLTYYLLGGYYPTSGPWPIVGYFFDADFNLIDRHVYKQFDENIAFDGGNNEHIVPLEDDTYLIAAQTSKLSPTVGGVGVAKYDMNHNPIGASPMFGTNHCYPQQTIIEGNNAIYQLYDIGGGWSTHKWGLIRLDSNLNIDWDIILPENQIYAFFGTSMIILKNRAIAACSICRKNMRYGATIVILHDDYDNTPEMTNKKCPFIIYPNPVKDQLALRFDDGSEPENVELYDLAGRLVGTKSNGLECIDMGAMPSGVYMLRVAMKDGSRYHEKIMKQ